MSTKYLITKIGVDTAENEPEISMKYQLYLYFLFWAHYKHRSWGRSGGRSACGRYLQGPIQTHLHTFKRMLKMNCRKRPKRRKNTFKTRYRLYAGTFIPHGRKPADWNIALQVVQLSVQAVERTLDKTALLVLTKEELITWLASGKVIVQEIQSYESYKIRIRSLLIVFSR